MMIKQSFDKFLGSFYKEDENQGEEDKSKEKINSITKELQKFFPKVQVTLPTGMTTGGEGGYKIKCSTKNDEEMISLDLSLSAYKPGRIINCPDINQFKRSFENASHLNSFMEKHHDLQSKLIGFDVFDGNGITWYTISFEVVKTFFREQAERYIKKGEAYFNQTVVSEQGKDNTGADNSHSYILEESQ